MTEWIIAIALHLSTEPEANAIESIRKGRESIPEYQELSHRGQQKSQQGKLGHLPSTDCSEKKNNEK